MRFCTTCGRNFEASVTECPHDGTPLFDMHGEDEGDGGDKLQADGGAAEPGAIGDQTGIGDGVQSPLDGDLGAGSADEGAVGAVGDAAGDSEHVVDSKEAPVAGGEQGGGADEAHQAALADEELPGLPQSGSGQGAELPMSAETPADTSQPGPDQEAELPAAVSEHEAGDGAEQLPSIVVEDDQEDLFDGAADVGGGPADGPAVPDLAADDDLGQVAVGEDSSADGLNDEELLTHEPAVDAADEGPSSDRIAANIEDVLGEFEGDDQPQPSQPVDEAFQADEPAEQAPVEASSSQQDSSGGLMAVVLVVLIAAAVGAYYKFGPGAESSGGGQAATRADQSSGAGGGELDDQAPAADQQAQPGQADHALPVGSDTGGQPDGGVDALGAHASETDAGRAKGASEKPSETGGRSRQKHREKSASKPKPATKPPAPEPEPKPATKPPAPEPEPEPKPAPKPPAPEPEPKPAPKPPAPEPEPKPATKPPAPEPEPTPKTDPAAGPASASSSDNDKQAADGADTSNDSSDDGSSEKSKDSDDEVEDTLQQELDMLKN